MNSVELLDEALAAARRLGFQIREEWLGGNSGGACRIRGQKYLFLDLNLSPRERLDQVLDALRSDPGLAHLEMSITLARVLATNRAA